MLIVTVDELYVIAMYRDKSRTTTLQQMEAVLKEIDSDPELSAVTGSEMRDLQIRCIEKLAAMTDEAYAALDFSKIVFD